MSPLVMEIIRQDIERYARMERAIQLAKQMNTSEYIFNNEKAFEDD